MILRKGKEKYRIPAYSLVSNVRVRMPGFAWVDLIPVKLQDLPGPGAHGVPWCYYLEERIIILYPAPYQQMEALVHYTPPLATY